MTMINPIKQLAVRIGKSKKEVREMVAEEAPKLATRMYEQMKQERLVLALSGGAPHSPLMAGALCAVHEKIGSQLNGGKGHFDAIFASGGSAPGGPAPV